MSYKPFLIQKAKATVDLGIDANVHSSDEWGIRVTDMPFKPVADAKDLPKTDYLDRHGDDEYVPDILPLKAYEIEITFAYKGLSGTAATKIQSFLNYIINGGVFSVYSEYTKVGRSKIRYVSYDDVAESFDEGVNEVITFKVKLKVNDPVTNVILSL